MQESKESQLRRYIIQVTAEARAEARAKQGSAVRDEDSRARELYALISGQFGCHQKQVEKLVEALANVSFKNLTSHASVLSVLDFVGYWWPGQSCVLVPMTNSAYASYVELDEEPSCYHRSVIAQNGFEIASDEQLQAHLPDKLMRYMIEEYSIVLLSPPPEVKP